MECMRLSSGDTQIVRCREVVRSSECPLLEVPLYMYIQRSRGGSFFDSNVLGLLKTLCL